MYICIKGERGEKKKGVKGENAQMVEQMDKMLIVHES
jgi:aspartate 1-decarboxylase